MAHRITPDKNRYGIYEAGGLYWWACRTCNHMHNRAGISGPYMNYVGALEQYEKHQKWRHVP
jgi:hypothetical protein